MVGRGRRVIEHGLEFGNRVRQNRHGRGAERQALSKKYDAARLPLLILLDSQGREMARVARVISAAASAAVRMLCKAVPLTRNRATPAPL